MGKIVISENISLDGGVQDPTGEEGFSRGGWFSQINDSDRVEWTALKAGEADRAAALLFGRRSYEWFAERWVTREGAWADRLRELPKHVVSTTLTDPAWVNSTVLAGDVIDAVTTLKEQVDGDIVVYGSGQLVHALMDHGLVDELRLTVFPVVVGGGDRVFGEMRELTSLRPLATETIGDTIIHLTYGVVRR